MEDLGKHVEWLVTDTRVVKGSSARALMIVPQLAILLTGHGLRWCIPVDRARLEQQGD